MHSDYERVSAAIEYLAARHAEQPSLGALSAELGLSHTHLQRVFSRWAGISPKRFVQFVTKEHAKALLAESSVLDASLSVGLSGTGRLHDPMVTTEAMTTGFVRRIFDADLRSGEPLHLPLRGIQTGSGSLAIRTEFALNRKALRLQPSAMCRFKPWLAFAFLSWVAAPAHAADTCTIAYKVEGSFVVSDTALGKGDTRQRIRGSLVLELPIGKDGEVVDGKTKILHYSMYEHFRIDSVADVTSRIHHYAPLCNGEDEPTWRRSSDKGFPSSCQYTGRGRAVAVGELRRAENTITLAKCKAAPTYWSSDRDAYRPTDKSKGKGCMERMHVAGNIHCDGRLACKLGELRPGDNPQFDVWTQPLIHGPPGSQGVLSISADLRTVKSPRPVLNEHGSFNLPNDSPSRTWFSFTAVRNDESRFTTCR